MMCKIKDPSVVKADGFDVLSFNIVAVVLDVRVSVGVLAVVFLHLVVPVTDFLTDLALFLFRNGKGSELKIEQAWCGSDLTVRESKRAHIKAVFLALITIKNKGYKIVLTEIAREGEAWQLVAVKDAVNDFLPLLAVDSAWMLGIFFQSDMQRDVRIAVEDAKQVIGNRDIFLLALVFEQVADLLELLRVLIDRLLFNHVVEGLVLFVGHCFQPHIL